MATYERKLQALGRLLDARVMRDIVVAESDHGLVIAGLGRVTDHAGEGWGPVSFEVSHTELDEILSSVKGDSKGDRSPSRWRPW